jgi:hypothetical protein
VRRAGRVTAPPGSSGLTSRRRVELL